MATSKTSRAQPLPPALPFARVEQLTALEERLIELMSAFSVRLYMAEAALSRVLHDIYEEEADEPTDPEAEIDRGEPHENDRQSVEWENEGGADYGGPANGLDENGVQ